MVCTQRYKLNYCNTQWMTWKAFVQSYSLPVSGLVASKTSEKRHEIPTSICNLTSDQPIPEYTFGEWAGSTITLLLILVRIGIKTEYGSRVDEIIDRIFKHLPDCWFWLACGSMPESSAHALPIYPGRGDVSFLRVQHGLLDVTELMKRFPMCRRLFRNES